MTQIEKIIRRHYLPKQGKRIEWEKCGNVIYGIIRQKEDEIMSKNLQYSIQCKKIDEMRKKTEDEYESYFAMYNMNGIKAGYDWINGNDKLKKLLNTNLN